MYVRGADGARAHAEEIAEELRVKEVGFDQGPVARVRLLPNLRTLGPRLGGRLPEVRAALERGEVEELGDGSYRVAGELLSGDDVIRGESVVIEGWALAEDGSLSVALDTSLDDELRLEARVNDLIRSIQVARRELGLEITDRIRVWIPEADLLAFSDRIAAETLAVEVATGPELALEKA